MVVPEPRTSTGTGAPRDSRRRLLKQHCPHLPFPNYSETKLRQTKSCPHVHGGEPIYLVNWIDRRTIIRKRGAN
jgi:hypothetical protein